MLKVATCQFAVSGCVEDNLARLKLQMRRARDRGARVAHFPEGALSGYAGVDLESSLAFDWGRLQVALEEMSELAGALKLWVVVGSAHRLSGQHKPHNSLYVIGECGRLVERYDKRFLGGSDMAHYSPGSHFSTWDIDGVSCGALICYDYRFPELYREYKRLGVSLMFHSFHAAKAAPDRIAAIGAAIGRDLAHLNAAPTHTYPGITMPAAMTTAAACNHMWISCPNSSARESCWPSFLSGPTASPPDACAATSPVCLSPASTQARSYTIRPACGASGQWPAFSTAARWWRTRAQKTGAAPEPIWRARAYREPARSVAVPLR